MRFLPGNAQHIGARHSQQDSFGFADPDDREFIAHGGFLAIVCDGMGGMEFGDAASRTAVRAFLDAYQQKTPAESIPDALERSVQQANRQVVDLSHSMGMSEGIGTTLVAVALHDRSLYYISVGDSGLFLCRAGECRTLNHPHVFANVLDAAVARGSLSREDADNHPERESLTSFIGAESLEEIDRNLEPYSLAPGDTVLLASDGMFKTLDAQEIRAALEGPASGWAEALVDRTIAKKREYQDNVTVLSVTVETENGPALPKTTVRMVAPVLAMPPPPVSEAAPQPVWTPPVQALPATPAAAKNGGAAVPGPRIWPVLVMLAVLAVGFAGWWFFEHRRTGGLIDHRVNDPALTRPAPPLSNSPDDKPDPTVRQPAAK